MPIKSFALGRLEGGSVRLLGTCFLVRANTFATAAHVLDGNDANVVAVMPEHLDDASAYQSQPRGNVSCIPLALNDIDPLHDLALLECRLGNLIAYPDMPHMASTDDVAVGDVVFSFGYPHAPFGSSIMVLQEALVGARVLVTKGTLKIRHVVINQQSVLGQSGAPVYSKKTLNLIGILVGVFAVGGGGHMSIGGVDPHTLHQTSYVVSAEYLASMLR